jgi:outer membrane protein assembly factor BamB
LLRVRFQLWHHRTAGPVFSTACVLRNVEEPRTLTLPGRRDGEVILIGSHDCCVYCLSSQDGELIWKTALDSAVYSTPFVWQCPCKDNCYYPAAGGSKCVVACSQKGFIYLLAHSTGQVLAKIVCGHEIFSSPVAHDDRIIVGCRDNYVYSIVYDSMRRDLPVEST